MAYIGNSPANVGNYQVVDTIASSFNGSLTSFALTAGGLAITPAKSGQLLVSINGVMQQPDDGGSNGFKVTGSNIVFSSAPGSGDSFWAMYQGQNVDVGTPSDDTVGLAQLTATGSPSNTTFLRGDNAWAVVNTNLVADTTPQLGGDLDLNSNDITGTGGIPAANLTGTIDNARIAGSNLTSLNATQLTSGTVPAARLSTGATQAESDNSTKLATTAYVTTKITTLIGGAPSTLNDLNELADAINNDANYNSTLTTALATKLPLAGGTMTGNLVMGTNLVDGVDISARDGVLTSTTATAAAALPKAGGTMTGNISHAGAFTIDTVGDISLDSEGAILIKNGGSEVGRISNSSNNLRLQSAVSDADIQFRGNDGGSTITALTLDMSSQGDASFNRHVKLADNGQLVLGDGSDLLIYHDGSNSYVKDSGVGDLYLMGSAEVLIRSDTNENMIKCVKNAQVNLYYDNSLKLNTGNSGVDVTGNITVSGTVDGVDVAAAGTLATNAMPKAGGTFTGNIDMPNNGILASSGTNSNLTIGTSSAGSSGVLKLQATGTIVLHQYGSAGGWKDTLEVLGHGEILAKNYNDTPVLRLEQSTTSTNFGTPTLKLGGHNGGDSYAANAVHSIGFNYTSASKPAVGIGYVPTTTAGNTYGDLRFATRNVHTDTAPTERMRIDKDGKVGINGNPDCMFTIRYNGWTQADGVSLYDSYGSNQTNNFFKFYRNGNQVGGITNTLSATAFNTSSDYRLKENVDYTWDATTRLKQLKPARFNFIADDTNTLVDGFIAHEVSSIVPEAISGEKDAVTAEVLYTSEDVETQNINYKEVDQEVIDGTKTTDDVKTVATKNVGDLKEASVPNMQGIDQSKLVPLLVKTIQELEARITALEA